MAGLVEYPPKSDTALAEALVLQRQQEQARPAAQAPDMGLVARMLVGALPGAGDVMAAQDSQAAGQQMAEALKAGDWGRAGSSGIEALVAGLGALPMVPALGGITRATSEAAQHSRGVFEGWVPSYRNPSEVKPVQIHKNPSQDQLTRMLAKSETETLRVVRDKGTGDHYVWDANDAIHDAVAADLGLKDWAGGIVVPP